MKITTYQFVIPFSEMPLGFDFSRTKTCELFLYNGYWQRKITDGTKVKLELMSSKDNPKNGNKNTNHESQQQTIQII